MLQREKSAGAAFLTLSAVLSATSVKQAIYIKTNNYNWQIQESERAESSLTQSALRALYLFWFAQTLILASINNGWKHVKVNQFEATERSVFFLSLLHYGAVLEKETPSRGATRRQAKQTALGCFISCCEHDSNINISPRQIWKFNFMYKMLTSVCVLMCMCLILLWDGKETNCDKVARKREVNQCFQMLIWLQKYQQTQIIFLRVFLAFQWALYTLPHKIYANFVSDRS
jgi:hypothetical protein